MVNIFQSQQFEKEGEEESKGLWVDLGVALIETGRSSFVTTQGMAGGRAGGD